MSHDDTDDLGSQRLDKTGAIRKVTAELEKAELEKRIRAEYEDKEQARLEKAVFSTRSRVDKLENTRVVELEKRIQKLETAVAILRWVAVTIVGAIITIIVAAVAGG